MAKKVKKRKYSRGSQKDVKSEMHRYKRGEAKSGPGGKAAAQSLSPITRPVRNSRPAL